MVCVPPIKITPPPPGPAPTTMQVPPLQLCVPLPLPPLNAASSAFVCPLSTCLSPSPRLNTARAPSQAECPAPKTLPPAPAPRSAPTTMQVPPLQLCVPCNSEAICWHPVTPAMNKPDYNKPDASVDVRKKKGAITSFFKPAASPAKPKHQQQQQAAKPQPVQTEQAEPQRDKPTAGEQQQQREVKGGLEATGE